MPLAIHPITPDAKGHRTRFSDSSFYDEVCVTCGATDASGALNGTCPNQVTDEVHAAERLETAKRQLIGMGSIHVGMLRESGPTVDVYWTKTLRDIANLIEVLLEERKKPGYEQGYKDGESSIHADYSAAFDGIVDVFSGPQDLAKQIEEKLNKLTVSMTVDPHVTVVVNGEGPDAEAAYQEMMAAGFGKHFEIQRANKRSAINGTIPKDIVFFIDDVEIHRVKDADTLLGDEIEFNPDVSGILTWGIEFSGVLIPANRGYLPKYVVKGDVVNLTGFKADLECLKTVKHTNKVVQVDVDETIDQHALDQADAIDFGVTYKAVKMAREAHEGEQAQTRLFFMADWNKLARFKRRDLALRTYNRHEGSPG